MTNRCSNRPSITNGKEKLEKLMSADVFMFNAFYHSIFYILYFIFMIYIEFFSLEETFCAAELAKGQTRQNDASSTRGGR